MFKSRSRFIYSSWSILFCGEKFCPRCLRLRWQTMLLHRALRDGRCGRSRRSWIRLWRNITLRLSVMDDGLYRINYKGICAGFVVKGGRVIQCAPILKKRINFWRTYAQDRKNSTMCHESRGVGKIKNVRDKDMSGQHRPII